jgi:homoserine dehydrogenase
MANRTIGIAMLGCGVVGAGVLDILLRQGQPLKQRTGLQFDVRHVVVRNPKRYADRPELKGLPLTSDARKAIADPEVEIVVEVMGGTDAAGDLVRAALRGGKRVVTANKALLALHGSELFALAREHGVCIGFEASCGGGVPIIGALQHGLVANRLHALIGIVNGTCNFILTRMTRNGLSYDDALKEAQRAGFAEADPTLDVSGRDTAQKLAILGGLAFNARIAESDIHVEGIERIDPLDIRFARELRYVIKLLAVGETVRGDSGDGLSLRVHPALVHEDNVLADVSGSFNAVSVWGDALGHALFYGRGAGSTPTASAVASDIVDMALGVSDAAFNQLRIFPDLTPPANLLPFAQLRSRYYLRLMVRDEPGVLAQVTRILGEQEISLSAILQHEMEEDHGVPVIITTHVAREGAMQSAVEQIDRLEAVMTPGVCLRIIDSPREFNETET